MDIEPGNRRAEALAVELQRMTAERDALRCKVRDLHHRLLTYRRAAIGAPAVDPKPAPRAGLLAAAFHRLELE